MFGRILWGETNLPSCPGIREEGAHPLPTEEEGDEIEREFLQVRFNEINKIKYKSSSLESLESL